MAELLALEAVSAGYGESANATQNLLLLLFNHERVHLLAQAGISKEQAKAMLYEYSMLPTNAFRKGDLAALREKGRVIGDRVSLVDGPAIGLWIAVSRSVKQASARPNIVASAAKSGATNGVAT